MMSEGNSPPKTRRDPSVILHTGEPGEPGGGYSIQVEAKVNRSGNAPCLIAWINCTTGERFIKKIDRMNMKYEEALEAGIRSALAHAPLRSRLFLYISSQRVRKKTEVHHLLRWLSEIWGLNVRLYFTPRKLNYASRMLRQKSLRRQRCLES